MEYIESILEQSRLPYPKLFSKQRDSQSQHLSGIGPQLTDYHLLGLINLIRKWLLEKLQNGAKNAGDVCIRKGPGTISIHKRC